MRMDRQTIKTSSSFYYCNYYLSSISSNCLLPDWSKISPRSPPNLSLTCWICDVKLLPSLKGFKLETSFKRYPFLFPFPLQWMKLKKYFSLNIRQADLAATTHQTFCLLCGVHRGLLVHMPLQKSKTVQNKTFVWVNFLQMTRQFLNIKILPKC